MVVSDGNGVVIVRRMAISRVLTKGALFFITAALIFAIGATPAFAPYGGETETTYDSKKTTDSDKTTVYYYPKIGENSVGHKAIIDGAVATKDLALAAVGTGRIKREAVTSAKIRNRTILNRDMRNNIVSSAKIRDGAILNRDMANGIVTTAKIKDGTIGNRDIAAGAGISDSKITYSTKRGFLTVPAAALRPVDSSTTYGGSFLNVYATGAGAFTFVAPVDLPNGARVTNVGYDVYDDSSFDSTAYLSRSGASPGSAQTMAMVKSSGSSSLWRTFNDPSIAYAVIDNEVRQYVVSIELRGEAGADLSAGRVTIEYTYTSPGS